MHGSIEKRKWQVSRSQKPKIVCLAKDKYKFQKDLERMLNLEHTRGENYFDRMYRVLQFTFAALIAIAVFSFGKESPALSKMLMLKFVIPAFIYVFGILFTYNTYALSICGKRATILLHALHNYPEKGQSNDSVETILRTYVGTDRKMSFLAYGVPLMFYILVPLISILISYNSQPETWPVFLNYLSMGILFVYYCFMGIMIYGVGINFNVKKYK